MNESPVKQFSPLIRIMLAVLSVLLIVYIPLKIYLARSEVSGPVPDGTSLSIFVTNELKAYREPCG